MEGADILAKGARWGVDDGAVFWRGEDGVLEKAFLFFFFFFFFSILRLPETPTFEEMDSSRRRR